MRKLSMAALGALVVVAACADNPTSPSELAPDGARFTHTEDHESHQHNGPVWVQLAFAVDGDAAVAPGVNAHPQGKGSCAQADGTVSGTQADNTVWFNDKGKRNTAAKFCQGSEGDGVTRTCTSDDIPATYAAHGNEPGAGNENLNFFTDEEEDVLDQFVHYKANADWTEGKGSIDVAFTCSPDGSGTASLALEQFSTVNPDGGNMFLAGPPGDWQLNVSGNPVVTTGIGDGEVTGLSWDFRSRVGE